MPTVSGGTEPGVVLGTMGYMSPEQVRGKPADKRSDLFSFGTILYEMLSGQRAFRGDTAADTITAILTKEPPDISQTNKDVPPGLDRIVRHCLEKNPEERFESARDVAFDLEALSSVSAPSVTGVRALPTKRTRLPWALLGLAAVVGALVGLYAGRRTASSTQPTFQRLTFQRGTVSTARFGPDGSTVTTQPPGTAPLLGSTRFDPGTRNLPRSRCRRRSFCRSRPPARWRSCSTRITTSRDSRSTGLSLACPCRARRPRRCWPTPATPNGRREAPSSPSCIAPAGRIDSNIRSARFSTKRRAGSRTRAFLRTARTIAFIDHSSAGDDGAVAIVDRAGKKTDLAGGWATVQGLAWSPDGREIWFTAAREGIERMVYGVTPAGKLRLIRTMQGTPALLDVRKDGGASDHGGRLPCERARLRAR